MTQTLIGIDYAGVPAVKITKGVIDPALEPDGNAGSFFFNSKWAADIKMTAVDPVQEAGGSVYIPGGTGQPDFWRYVDRLTASERNWYRNTYFSGLLYTLPLHDFKQIRISNGRFVGSAVFERLSGYQDRAGNWITGGVDEVGWCTSLSFAATPVGYVGNGTFTDSYFAWPGGILNEPFKKSLVVWRLPGDETAILDGAPQSPVAGQHSIEIDSAGMRVAKPGYDVRFATPTQLAFDSANRPSKVIAASDIFCPPGVTAYDCGIPIPPGTVADVHFYEGGVITFPANPVARQYGCEYWFDGQYLYFNNTFATACRARFYVIAFDGSAPTSGDNDVIRQFSSGGQDVVQILRPGASAAPSFADIVVDSRWPCLQMLAEGSFSVGSGALTHVVNFEGSGTFPMVKYMTIHGPGSSLLYGSFSWGKRVRQPYVNMCGTYNVGWTYAMGGDSTYCELSTSQAVFHTFGGAPVRRYYRNASDFSSNVVTSEYDPAPLYGIRYFIFGIPA